MCVCESTIFRRKFSLSYVAPPIAQHLRILYGSSGIWVKPVSVDQTDKIQS